jgi:hypothetical protein
MRRMASVVLIAIVVSAGASHGQRTASPPTRFGAALGIITPGAHWPTTLSVSLSGVVIQREGNPFQLQLDGTFTSLDYAAVTASIALSRPVRAVTAYALAGGGYTSFPDGKTVTSGFGAKFRYRGVPLFTEFRVYYPSQDLLSGLRFGLRF